MIEFLKRYSYDSVRMFLNQVAIAMFGFSLALAAVKAQSDAFLWIGSVASIVFYLLLEYSVAWKIGFEERGSIDRGQRAFHWWKGTAISLMANSINLILALIIAIQAWFLEGGSGAARGIALVIQGMYQGILATLRVGQGYLNTQWWAYLLIIAPAVLISTGGYCLGVKGWHITNLLMPEIPASDRPTREEKKQERADRHKNGT